MSDNPEFNGPIKREHWLDESALYESVVVVPKRPQDIPEITFDTLRQRMHELRAKYGVPSPAITIEYSWLCKPGQQFNVQDPAYHSSKLFVHPHDMAGIIFRMHGLTPTSLQMAADVIKSIMHKHIDSIFKPLEFQPQNRFNTLAHLM